MKIIVKESTMVKPKEDTPSGSLWLSNSDLVMPEHYHSRCIFYFCSNGAANFFDTAVLKAALSHSLVDFYPYAGRLRKDNNGRIEVNCTGEGMLFVEAECDATLDDYGATLDDLDLPPGFTPRADVNLIPKVDYSQGISTFPLLLIQLTRFKCGGVSIGLASDHHVADAIGCFQYFYKWSVMARGNATKPPFLDRRVLSARSPPQPQFPHMEHQPSPSLKSPLDIGESETSFRTFVLSVGQINALKEKCNEYGDGTKTRYSTHEVITGHVWRSVCLARRLSHDQETQLLFSVNGRQRLQPPLPPNYFGNAIFSTTAIATCGEMESNPLSFAVGKVHEAVARMDDDYIRSAVDHLELQLPKSRSVVRTSNGFKCPNFMITNWVQVPFYQVDFGWGKPNFVGPGEEAFVEGRSYLFADPENEGGLLLAIKLFKPHMDRFQDLIYHIIKASI